MKMSKQYGPANTIVKIDFDMHDALTAEAGSMIGMSAGLQMETTTHQRGKRGIFKALKRMLAGESFFLNHYTAYSSGTHLMLSSGLPGDIQIVNLQNKKIIVQATSFLAGDARLSVDTGWQGFKNLFSGESLFWLQVEGTGEIALSSFGAIYEIDVQGEYIVDTGHIVAFDSSLNFSLSKAGSSWFHSFLGSEGLICHFKGHGKLYCQSHNPSAFGHALTPFLRAKKG